MFVELRGELHEVARHSGAGETGILGISEHAVQRVAEFVEHAGYVVKAQEGGLARRGLCEISNIVDDRVSAE